MKKSTSLFFIVGLLTLAKAAPYGSEGHALVGAIADARLASTPRGAALRAS